MLYKCWEFIQVFTTGPLYKPLLMTKLSGGWHSSNHVTSVASTPLGKAPTQMHLVMPKIYAKLEFFFQQKLWFFLTCGDPSRA